MDFIFDPNLVLYLPLGELDGASLMSRDAYGHLVTVTGAVWTPQGRSFDGVDDQILHTADAWRGADAAGTIIVWFKTNTAATMALFSSADEGNNIRWLEFGITSNVLRVSQRANDVADQINATTNIKDDNWHHGALVSSGTAYSIYLGGMAESLTVVGGANTGDWLADTPNRDNATVGVTKLVTPQNYYTGSIGEVLVYNRALTALEIQRHHLATKWRYQ